jgi:hypothetical protein
MEQIRMIKIQKMTIRKEILFLFIVFLSCNSLKTKKESESFNEGQNLTRLYYLMHSPLLILDNNDFRRFFVPNIGQDEAYEGKITLKEVESNRTIFSWLISSEKLLNYDFNGYPYMIGFDSVEINMNIDEDIILFTYSDYSRHEGKVLSVLKDEFVSPDSVYYNYCKSGLVLWVLGKPIIECDIDSAELKAYSREEINLPDNDLSDINFEVYAQTIKSKFPRITTYSDESEGEIIDSIDIYDYVDYDGTEKESVIMTERFCFEYYRNGTLKKMIIKDYYSMKDSTVNKTEMSVKRKSGVVNEIYFDNELTFVVEYEPFK